MKAAVIDASVVAAAFFPEPHSAAGQAMLTSDVHLHAPDLIYAEVANVIWKRHRRGEIDGRDAADLWGDILSLSLDIVPSEQLAGPALELALRTGRTVYDCLYVALALQTKTVMVSTDRRLVNALASGPLKDSVSWLGQPR